MNKVAIVSDLKVIDSPQAGLGVSRCLKDAGFKIIGIDDTSFVTSDKNLFEDVFCWEEIRTLNFDSLINKIINVKKVYGLDYIFPCYDETAILFSFIKEKIEHLEIKLIIPTREVLKKIQKINLPKIVNYKNYRTPETKQINSIKEAINCAEKVGYPVICKGLVKGAHPCENETALILNIKKLSNIWNNGEVNCLIQKYINDKESEFRNCVIGIKNNKIVGYAEMVKIGSDQNGATWFGKIDKNKELLEFAEHLVKLLPFGTSIVEIESIKIKDTYYIYEINPRSPAWIFALCQLGLNIPSLILKYSQSKIKFVPEEGYFGRETKDFIRKDIDSFGDNIKYYSKAAAYKSGNLKYPSELL